jgi:hypothetical protein
VNDVLYVTSLIQTNASKHSPDISSCIFSLLLLQEKTTDIQNMEHSDLHNTSSTGREFKTTEEIKNAFKSLIQKIKGKLKAKDTHVDTDNAKLLDLVMECFGRCSAKLELNERIVENLKEHNKLLEEAGGEYKQTIVLMQAWIDRLRVQNINQESEYLSDQFAQVQHMHGVAQLLRELDLSQTATSQIAANTDRIAQCISLLENAAVEAMAPQQP